ncbi:MAG: Tar ligand binding domain-containing protein [Bacillota bacterium]
MKKNFPITGQEKDFPDGLTLVSRTDTKGVITFANDAFVEVSGFAREELVGASHNLVRHPDVPAAIFEDMWATLKKGLPWRGLVKNRCKNGDHYWVDAQVVPVRKNGATIGYMSVRSKPAREAIAKAEADYREAERSGRVQRQDGQRGWKKCLSVKNGVTLGIVFVTLMMIAGGILGITGLTLSSSAMRGLYYEQMAPVQAIGRINFLMADNRARIVLAVREQSAGSDAAASLAKHMAQLTRNRQEIDALWADYGKLARSGTERELAERYWQARTRYVEAGLLPAQLALEKGDAARAQALMVESVNPLYDEANSRAEALLGFLSKKAQANFAAVAERNEAICIVAVIGISAGCLILLLAGVYFFRATVLPLQAAVDALERIGEGNLSGESGVAGYGEPGRVMAGVAMMRLHLKVMMNEIRQSSGSIREQCTRLNQTMMNLAQHSEEQHDRVYHTLDSANAASEGLAGLAQDAERMLCLTESAPGGQDPARQDEQLPLLARELVAAARLQAFAMDETVEQMNQVASLIVENRGEVQRAWAASERLEQTAGELDGLVRYFD